MPEPWPIVLANNALTGLWMTLVCLCCTGPQVHCRTFVAVLLSAALTPKAALQDLVQLAYMTGGINIKLMLIVIPQ